MENHNGNYRNDGAQNDPPEKIHISKPFHNMSPPSGPLLAKPTGFFFLTSLPHLQIS